MKRYMLYASAVAAMLGFSACNEDFSDWADPQYNPQQPSADKVTCTIENGSDVDIDINKEETPDSVELVKYASSNIMGVKKVEFTKLLMNGTYEVPFKAEGHVLKVATAQLDSVTQVAYHSKAYTVRNEALSVNVAIITEQGQAFDAVSNEVTVNYTTKVTPQAEDAYYIVGDLSSWSADGALAMTKGDDGVFTLDVETTNDNCCFKIFPQSAIVGNELDWDHCYGSAIDGDNSGDGFIVWSNAQALKIDKAGNYRITVDPVNFVFTVKAVADELYMTGSNYGWSEWVQFVPVKDADGNYWRVIYLNAGEEFKFAPQAGWGNDFGAEATVNDYANSGIAGTGNLVCANAGWYILHVDAVNRVVNVYEPNVYLIGETAGGWDVLAENKLTVPATADGEFVSKAFVNAAEVRVCVHFDEAYDWWKTEFIVLGGNIEYRGSGDDQERVKAEAGQKLYLNFTSGVGSIK